MKSSKFLSSSVCLLSIVLTAGGLNASTVIFSENFTSTTLVSNANPYLGGWFTPQAALQAWNGPGEASITTGALTVTSTSGTRSAGTLLSPGLFPQAGTYTLSFDVTAYSGASNNSGLVTIWSGTGYDLGNASPNALVLDTLFAELKPSGLATAALLGSTLITESGNGWEVSFNYDGTSAVALFFGVTTSGWPFPTATYDNISISRPSPAAIPEPSVPTLVALVAAAFCLVRRRRP